MKRLWRRLGNWAIWYQEDKNDSLTYLFIVILGDVICLYVHVKTKVGQLHNLCTLIPIG